MGRLGIIAEDQTDCATVAVLIRRMLELRGVNAPSFKTWAAKGCCKIPVKAAPTMKLWATRDGVDAVVIVHDCDRDGRTNAINDHSAIQEKLERATAGAQRRLVVVPVEELEAWFWCDQSVLDYVAGAPNKGMAHPEPHRIAKPKEALERLSRGANRKPRYDTNENVELAKRLNLDTCAKHCEAFRRLRAFVEALQP